MRILALLAVIITISIPLAGQDTSIPAGSFRLRERFAPLLQKLRLATSCRDVLAKADEFETTAQYKARYERYRAASVTLLHDAVAAFNAKDATGVGVSFSLRQGQYNADQGLYKVVPVDDRILVDSGFGVEGSSATYSWREFFSQNWFIGPIGIEFPADGELARQFRGRELGMRMIISFRVTAFSQVVQGWQNGDYSDEHSDNRYYLGLVLRPVRVEIRSPLERDKPVVSRPLDPGTLLDKFLLWSVTPGNRCGT